MLGKSVYRMINIAFTPTIEQKISQLKFVEITEFPEKIPVTTGFHLRRASNVKLRRFIIYR